MNYRAVSGDYSGRYCKDRAIVEEPSASVGQKQRNHLAGAGGSFDYFLTLDNRVTVLSVWFYFFWTIYK